ncbi:thiamine-phosphate kinase [Methylophaga sp. OBS3]|uniref:thiamine-phosphate kinase n=1 Tax=Methylophaga sp. OBS3 TaxID=2991934 RepID=UPI002259D442|nr:thiamine-phosphate kinase [Methylophaga sp. OBS3]MCX4190371.1 thiamine-phosphate kinase [Methylophaga sp. OBS3]
MASSTEFSLIRDYFSALTDRRDDVILGIGDDCALLQPPAGHILATSVDTLVSGVHFFADVDPFRLGHKALAVNLSDLAAMGATPAWFTLALTLPEANPQWLQAFSAGMAALAKQHNIQLVGGDTTRGPLTISIQVTGFCDRGNVLRRDAARPGDKIFVTGSLGDAGTGLLIKQNQLATENLSTEEQQFLIDRLELPTPRNELVKELLPEVKSGIDISDGLLADLKHILTASNVGAVINTEALPLSSSLQKLKSEQAIQLALTAGDDYELCFTVAAEKADALTSRLGSKIQCIGEITAEPELIVLPEQSFKSHGYDHFNKT